LAQLGDDRLKCSREELADALRGAPTPTHLAVLPLFLERLKLLDSQIVELDQLVAVEMKKHEDAVIRVAEIPGFGVNSAQPILAEVGIDAATFASAGEFSSWVGVCPGSNVSAGTEPQFPLRERKSLCAQASDASRSSGGAEEGMLFPVAAAPLFA
jgi:transposase